jgi:hypothetical protein
MGQQMAQCDRPLRGAHLRRAGGVEAFEDRGRAERGVDVGHRALERELALLDELHGRDGSDGLRHGRDAEDRVGRHGCGAVERAQAEGALVQHALVGSRHRDDTGHVLRIHRLLQQTVDAGATAGLGVGPAERRGMADRGSGGDGSGSLQQVAAAVR